MEGDALQVVLALKLKIKNWCRLDDAFLILNSIQQWGVSYIRREANEAAHRLTKLALFVVDEVIHIEDIPLGVVEVVIDERNVRIFLNYK